MATRAGSRYVSGIAALCASFFAQGTSQAHFILESPSAMNEQNDLGDPQKAPPCGDNGNAVPTGLVTTVRAGSTITVTIDETVFHPGHYRIALAVDDIGELPDPAPVTPGNTPCGSAPIQDPPVFPVLADGVFEHAEPFTEPQSIDITLPDDVTCTKCTLQVIQFMSNHALNDPGGCYYHHCANIAVEPGPAEATSTSSDDSGATSEGGGPSETTATTAPPADGTAGMGDTSEDPDDDDDDTNGASPGSGTAGVDTDPGQAPTNTDGGCSCSSSQGRGSPPLGTLVGLLALVGVRARRRADRRPR